jgi:Fe-S-cluster containining protein
VRGAEHLHFSCNGCGDCCRRHRVAVTHLDLRRLTGVVAAPLETLVEWLPADTVDLDAESASMVALPGGARLMVLAHGREGCHFLTADARCGVYAARPRDCEAYPFVLERGKSDEPRSVVRLSLFDPAGCGDRAELPLPLAELEQTDRRRWDEVAAYRALVARWNRLAGHRKRLGRPALGVPDFLAFVLPSIP